MKNVFSFVLWIATMSVILGAHFTAIPILVTIATAIYWIASVAFTFVVAGLGLTYLCTNKETMQSVWKPLNERSTLRFIVNVIQSILSLWVCALVGWAWPFAMALIIYVTFISVRLNKE